MFHINGKKYSCSGEARNFHYIKWKERTISKKDRTLSWREQELRKTRVELLKYQKEWMSRSQELTEVRHWIARNKLWERNPDYEYTEYDPRKFLQLFLLFSTNYQVLGLIFQTIDPLCHQRQLLFHTASIKLLSF